MPLICAKITVPKKVPIGNNHVCILCLMCIIYLLQESIFEFHNPTPRIHDSTSCSCYSSVTKKTDGLVLTHIMVLARVMVLPMLWCYPYYGFSRVMVLSRVMALAHVRMLANGVVLAHVMV